MTPRCGVTGLVLAGGRGTRMGGIDKGLARYRGGTLVYNAATRLAPQVESIVVSANRHLDLYRTLGFPVCVDAPDDAFAGPLAGFLGGLEISETEWVVTVPCDTPNFPLDLVHRLREAADAIGAPLAVIRSGTSDGTSPPQLEPTFCLIHRSLTGSLRASLSSGERKVSRWIKSQCHAVAHYADDAPFANANTPEQLAWLDPR